MNELDTALTVLCYTVSVALIVLIVQTVRDIWKEL